MDNEDIRRQIKNATAKGKLKEAIELCVKYGPPGNFHDAAIMLSGKFYYLKEKAGTIPPEEARRITAEIRVELISLANELEDIGKVPDSPLNISEIVKWPRQRTELLVKSAKKIADSNHSGKIRQKAAFSSFSLPKVEPEQNWQQWEECFIPRYDISGEYYFLLWKERMELEAHAKAMGCRLIVYPRIYYFEEGSRKIRLKHLLDFINSMIEDGKLIEIVLAESAKRENITIIGEYLLMKSYSASTGGFKDTLFNTDPFVLNYHTKEFDYQFDRGVRKMIDKYKLPADINVGYENAIQQVRRKSISILEEVSS